MSPSDNAPDARLDTIGYGGHIAMAESAEPVNRTVLQRLSEDR